MPCLDRRSRIRTRIHRPDPERGLVVVPEKRRKDTTTGAFWASVILQNGPALAIVFVANSLNDQELRDDRSGGPRRVTAFQTTPRLPLPAPRAYVSRPELAPGR